MSKLRRMRELLRTARPLVSPGVYDGSLLSKTDCDVGPFQGMG